MPDIRTLLNDVTTRMPNADPVGAVHAAVRHRTRVRAAAATGATVVVVVAVLATVAGAGDKTSSPVSPPSPSATTTSPTPAPTTAAPVPDQGALLQYVESNPEAFLGVTETEAGFVVLFAPGIDQALWKERLDAASGGYPYTVKTCPQPLSYYEALIAEVDAFHWPSGAKPTAGAALDPGTECEVAAWLDHATTADRNAARAKWGDKVVVR